MGKTLFLKMQNGEIPLPEIERTLGAKVNEVIQNHGFWEFSKFCVTVQFSDLLLHLAEVEARP